MPEIQIGTATVVSPTTTPTTPPTPKCLSPEEWLSQHTRVKSILDDYSRRGLCITPDELASRLGINPSLAETHLELMKTDKNAVQVATVNGKKVYCTEELIRKIISDLESI